MKKSFRINNLCKYCVIVTALLIATGNINAVIIDSNQTIDSGNYSIVSVVDDAILNVTGGYIDTCHIQDNGSLDISGGGIDIIYANNNNVNIYYLTLTQNYFELNNPLEGTGTYRAAGTWIDGTAFSLYFSRQDEQLENIALIHVPEPATFLIFGSLIVFVRKR